MDIFKKDEDLCTESMFEKLVSSYFNSHAGEDKSLVDNVLQVLQENVIMLVDEADEWECFTHDINKIMQGV